jgi:genome maintenance exonuclease 1
MSYQIKRVQKHGLRHYQVTENGKVLGTFPSITTVLGQTSDKSGLEKWKKRVGEAEAKRISELSMNRGTIMHRLIELYKPLPGDKTEKLEALKELAKTDEEVNQYSGDENGPTWLEEGWKMFMKFYMNSSQFFDEVEEVLEAETFLWSKVGYAGTVDNISKMAGNKIKVIDYKNSRKPKREEWIQDYFVQGSAYFIAYWERTGIKPHGVEIWIANEVDAIPQKFTLSAKDIKFYFSEFVRRLNQFKEMYNA